MRVAAYRKWAKPISGIYISDFFQLSKTCGIVLPMREIYLDNASTTAVDPFVLKTVTRVMESQYGNVGSPHSSGVSAKQILDDSRSKIAKAVNCRSEEIIFTSGGTESNNLAILGAARKISETIPYTKMHMVTSAIEHSSVVECFQYLETLGVSVSYVLPSEEGVISAEVMKKYLRPNTVLVSIMYANNEIGVVLPIRRMANVLSEFSRRTLSPIIPKPYFHIDACQAPLYLDVNKETLGADLISFDAHKIYGPKGVGCLFLSKSVEILPVIFGGGQEKSLRSGTENVPLIAGFAEAFALADKRKRSDSARVSRLREYFISRIKKLLPEAVFNGSDKNYLPNILNISLPGINSDLAVMRLSSQGIYCSSKSACRGDGEGSYVVAALGKKNFENSSLRFSLSRLSKKSEIDRTVTILYGLFKEGLLVSG